MYQERRRGRTGTQAVDEGEYVSDISGSGTTIDARAALLDVVEAGVVNRSCQSKVSLLFSRTRDRNDVPVAFVRIEEACGALEGTHRHLSF